MMERCDGRNQLLSNEKLTFYDLLKTAIKTRGFQTRGYKAEHRSKR